MSASICIMSFLNMFQALTDIPHVKNNTGFYYLQILPMAVRTLLDEEVRLAIIKMCRVFQRICEKEI